MMYWMIDVDYIPNKLPENLAKRRKTIAKFEERPKL
jgi:hypothetical protein